MIEEIGTITATVKQDDKQFIYVETQIKTTCGGCQANDDCGTGILAKAFSPKKEQVYLLCEEEVKVGQKVKLGIPETTLLSASVLVYILPLVIMMAIAILAQSLLPLLGLVGELWVVGLALLSAILTFYYIRSYIKNHKLQDYQPHLIATFPWQGESIDILTISNSSTQE